ncbi:MAG: DUF3658 domain-containing protein [Kangiellaceae bacterium]|nr:DUF3658 domain-containing protein [Kangiellaceae bacterium]
MSLEVPRNDSELTKEQLDLVSKLSEEQVEEIDIAILENIGKQWRKVAMVVAMTMNKIPNRVIGVPDVFYSQRIANLVRQGKLVSQGGLNRMRFTEVKLA